MLNLVRLGLRGLTRGEIYGVRVARNPIAWIPFFLLLPVVFLIWILSLIVWFVASPLVFTLTALSGYSFEKKTGVFSDTGIYFPRSYGKITIAWTNIREVVRVAAPKAPHYRIVCDWTDAQYVMTTLEDEAFEQTLMQKGIPVREDDGRNSQTGGLNA